MTNKRRGLIGGTGSNSNSASGLVSNDDYLRLSFNQKQLENFGVVSKELGSSKTYTRGICISSDGRKFYAVHSSGAYFAEYTLSTPFDITSGTYVRDFNLTSFESQAYGVAISPDGRYFYVCGTARDNPIMFTASTPYDISTLTYGNNIRLFDNIFNIAGAGLEAFEFGDNGNKLYIIGSTYDNIRQFSLSTPYDVGTQSYDGEYSFGATITIPVGISWKPDGTRVFIMNQNNDSIYEYSCSNAWDVTTGTVSLVQSESVTLQDSAPVGLTFKPDGTKMYITGDTGNEIDEYDLGTAWDISTKTFVQVKTSVSNGAPGNIAFSSDGTTMILTSRGTGGRVDQFTLSTAWDISTAGSPTAYDPNESPLTTQTNTKGYITSLECAVFGNDGMSISLMDVYDTNTDRIITYPLRSAYDLTTILNGVLGSSKNGFTAPSDLKFNKDGTKCYVCDISNRTIYQYSLTIPYIIGEGNKSFDGSRSLSGDISTNGLQGMAFDVNGECLYVMDQYADRIIQYNVSTAFDLTSTITLDKTFTLNDYDQTPGGLDISSIGHKLYFMGQYYNKIFSLDLIF